MPSERETLRRNYNSLIETLRQDGHTIEVKGRKRKPNLNWESGVPPEINFIPKSHVHLPTYYRNASARVEPVADLLQALHSYSKRRILTDVKAEAAFANLVKIFAKMIRPPDLSKSLKDSATVLFASRQMPKNIRRNFLRANVEELRELEAISDRSLKLFNELSSTGVLSPRTSGVLEPRAVALLKRLKPPKR